MKWRICLTIQETQEMLVWFLGQKDPLEQEMTTHSSILAWKIPWIEEPGGLQSIGSQKVKHDWVTECVPACVCTHVYCRTQVSLSHLSVLFLVSFFPCFCLRGHSSSSFILFNILSLLAFSTIILHSPLWLSALLLSWLFS